MNSILVWGSVVTTAITIVTLRLLNRNGDDESDVADQLQDDQLHPLLKNYTHFKSYETRHATYPSVRTFYHPHAHRDKLEQLAELPLLVFIHGLGGTLPQFAPILGSFVNVAPCFGIELPGHGRSDFQPRDYEAYTMEAFVALHKTAIEDVCSTHGHRRVVLIGHSMGCSVSALLVSSNTAPTTRLTFPVEGMVAICPKANPPTASQARTYRRLLALPGVVLDALRWFDRRGKENSPSVKRFVGEGAGVDLKRTQLRLNSEFKTPVWKRAALGMLEHTDWDGTTRTGMPGGDVWHGLQIPLLLIAGQSDVVTPPSEISDVVAFIQDRSSGVLEQPADRTGGYMGQLAVETPLDDQRPADAPDLAAGALADECQCGAEPAGREIKSQHSSIIKTVVLPAPAAHALMYDHATYRTVAGLIEDFLTRRVSPHLSLGWQLQQLTTSGKWDVKNLEKWKRVLPVSAPIGGGVFRALKTLREQDEEHTPSVFLDRWAERIFAVIDISHDSPVYDTKALEHGGVQYHKFPTVSKIPPTLVEVQDFIALVDRLRKENEEQNPGMDAHRPERAIAVHCHYGYNRTGFFVICYMTEKQGYRVQDAIEEFARAKPPGIRHDHFLDTLFVRYCVGLRKAPTFSGDVVDVS